MWIILSAASRFIRDRPGRKEAREIKRRNLTKDAKLKKPRPSRAKRIASAAAKPSEYPQVYGFRPRPEGRGRSVAELAKSFDFLGKLLKVHTTSATSFPCVQAIRPCPGKCATGLAW